MEQVTIAHFTDPMMGLSWECEPMLRKIETSFGKQVALRNVMGLLVRDVVDFMTPEERKLPESEGLARYNRRLAQIYLQEEPIAGMPINMEGFCLFAPDRRTSLPLCLAYEAVLATRPKLADRFLYQLRYATVVECQPTTKFEELLRVAQICGIGPSEFSAAYESPATQDRLYQDLALKEQLRIYGLPAFVVSYGARGSMLHGVPTYQQLKQAIVQVSEGIVRPSRPQATPEALSELLDRHPLMSLVEVAAAFDLTDVESVTRLAKPLLTTGRAHLARTSKGAFLARQ